MRPTSISRRSTAIALALALALASCPSSDSDVDLPPEETPTLLDDDDDATPIGDDDSAGPIDDTPADLLSVIESGTWARSPEGGPYNAITGAIQHLEIWNGVAPPDPEDPEDPGGPPGLEGPNCRLAFAVTAVPGVPDVGCPGCDIWDFSLRLDSGDPAWCFGPERFEDGTQGRFGWSETARTIYLDYEGLGVWLYWYSVTEDDDDLLVEWTGEFGFTPPDVDR